MQEKYVIVFSVYATRKLHRHILMQNKRPMYFHWSIHSTTAGGQSVSNIGSTAMSDCIQHLQCRIFKILQLPAFSTTCIFNYRHFPVPAISITYILHYLHFPLPAFSVTCIFRLPAFSIFWIFLITCIFHYLHIPFTYIFHYLHFLPYRHFPLPANSVVPFCRDL